MPGGLETCVAGEEDGRLVVTLAGELDVASQSTVMAVVDAAVNIGVSLLVFDVSNVSFADCRGLQILLDARARAWAHGANLLLQTPSPPLELVLRLTSLDDELLVDESPAHSRLAEASPPGS